MQSSLTCTVVLAFLGLLMGGSVHEPYVVGGATEFGVSSAAQAPPPGAGEWNGTTLTMHVSDIGPAVVRYVRLTTADEESCRSEYRTRGNVSEPWTIGWSIGIYPGGFSLPAIGNSTATFSHEFIREGTVNAELVGTGAPGTVGGDFPQQAYGGSSSTLGIGAGREILYIVAASYPPPGPDGRGGQMEFQVECPGGVSALQTGWSTTAHLLSDISFDGTRASVCAGGNHCPTRWGATPLAEWSADLPDRPTTFIATEPITGLATLTSPSGTYTCGPSQDLEKAARGQALCMHEYGGAETLLEISQSAIGGNSTASNIGQGDTYEYWMGLVAQMEYYTWLE